jgi:hypothetical protein
VTGRCIFCALDLPLPRGGREGDREIEDDDVARGKVGGAQIRDASTTIQIARLAERGRRRAIRQLRTRATTGDRVLGWRIRENGVLKCRVGARGAPYLEVLGVIFAVKGLRFAWGSALNARVPSLGLHFPRNAREALALDCPFGRSPWATPHLEVREKKNLRKKVRARNLGSALSARVLSLGLHFPRNAREALARDRPFGPSPRAIPNCQIWSFAKEKIYGKRCELGIWESG